MALQSLPLALVVDIGSSSIRCNALPADPDGSASCNAYTARVPHSLAADGTLDALAVVGHCLTTLEDARKGAAHEEAAREGRTCVVRDVVFACVAMSLVGTDPVTGEAVTPVLTYAGRDAGLPSAVEGLRARVDAQAQHDRTGAPIHAAYAPAQLYNLQRTGKLDAGRPLVWCSLPTFVISRLTGLIPREVGVARSEAAWAGLLNVASGDWDDETLASVGLTRENVPPIRGSTFHVAAGGCGSGDDVGWSGQGLPPPPPPLPPASADALLGGNSAGAKATAVRFWLGVGDGAAAAVGSGALASPTLSLTVGTSAALRTVLRRDHAMSLLCGGGHAETAPLAAPSTASSYSCTHCGRLRLSQLGLWAYQFSDEHLLVGGALTDGGSLPDFFSSSFGAETTQVPLDPTDVNERAGGLICLPFWSGERATGWDAAASGCFVGLRYSHEPRHLLAAALEGVAFRIRAILERLEFIVGAQNESTSTGRVGSSSRAEASFGGFRVVGSGAGLTRSVLWRGIIADILGLPIHFVPEGGEAGGAVSATPALETTTLGAHMLVRHFAEGGGAAGEGAPRPSTTSTEAAEGYLVVRPDPARGKTYEALYRRHLLVYEALASLHGKLHAAAAP
jgi:gluconokinase